MAHVANQTSATGCLFLGDVIELHALPGWPGGEPDIDGVQALVLEEFTSPEYGRVVRATIIEDGEMFLVRPGLDAEIRLVRRPLYLEVD